MDQQQQAPAIAMIPVESSQFAKYGYDPATQTLAIEFHPRKPDQPPAVYHYGNFTPEAWALFEAAESKGTHFNRAIKCKVLEFPYKRIS